MNFKLKKVKIHEDMTEETLAFTAEVWADGKFICYAKNSGRGGCTDLNNYKDSETLNKAMGYCKTLPQHVFPATKHSDELAVDMSLDFMVELLAEDEAFIKSLKPHFNKGVVYGKMHGEVAVYGNKTSIAKLKKTEAGQAAILRFIKNVKGSLNEGEQIFNTNLKGYL